VGSPSPVRGRLRDDLRLRIVPDSDGTTADTSYTITRTQAPPVLRDREPFVATILDGVDARLRSWGIEPPDAYEHVETAGTTQTYAGTLTLY